MHCLSRFGCFRFSRLFKYENVLQVVLCCRDWFQVVFLNVLIDLGCFNVVFIVFGGFFFSRFVVV